jgi:hypothetical protein
MLGWGIVMLVSAEAWENAFSDNAPVESLCSEESVVVELRWFETTVLILSVSSGESPFVSAIAELLETNVTVVEDGDEREMTGDSAMLVIVVSSGSSASALLEEKRLGVDADAERESDDADLENTLCGLFSLLR